MRVFLGILDGVALREEGGGGGGQESHLVRILDPYQFVLRKGQTKLTRLWNKECNCLVVKDL